MAASPLSNSNANTNSIAQGAKIKNSIAAINKLQAASSQAGANNLKAPDYTSAVNALQATEAQKIYPSFQSPEGQALSKAVESGNGGFRTDYMKDAFKTISPINPENLYTTGTGSVSGSRISNSYNSNKADSKTAAKSKEILGKSLSAKNPNSLSDDEKRLLEAINARDRDNRSKYEHNDNDTIFDQITKAHIRNYDKIEN